MTDVPTPPRTGTAPPADRTDAASSQVTPSVDVHTSQPVAMKPSARPRTSGWDESGDWGPGVSPGAAPHAPCVGSRPSRPRLRAAPRVRSGRRRGANRIAGPRPPRCRPPPTRPTRRPPEAPFAISPGGGPRRLPRPRQPRGRAAGGQGSRGSTNARPGSRGFVDEGIEQLRPAACVGRYGERGEVRRGGLGKPDPEGHEQVVAGREIHVERALGNPRPSGDVRDRDGINSRLDEGRLGSVQQLGPPHL